MGGLGGILKSILKGRKTDIFARYETLREAVSGTMSQFYKARDRETGEVLEETDTLMCVHCQFTWRFKPGSGVERGYCYRCSGVPCGKDSCIISCNPFEAVIELQEAEYRELRKRLGIPV